MKNLYKTALSIIAAAAAAVSLCAGASAYAGEDIYRVKGFDDNEIALAELFKSTLESFIEEGNQKIDGHVYGKSITDACIGWPETERLLRYMAEHV